MPVPPTAARPVALGVLLPLLGELLLLLPPQAASAIAMTSAMATTPAPLRLRDPRTCLTWFPQMAYRAGTRPAERVNGECDRRHSDRTGAT